MLVKKGDKQLNGFDVQVISLYARGMTTREIQAHLEDLYSIQISATFIPQAANAVMDEVKSWQNRLLNAAYPTVYLDVPVVQRRDSGVAQKKSLCLALRISCDGENEILRIWMADTGGAKFCLSVMTALKNRGLQNIFITCTNDLKGFTGAIETMHPYTQVQQCIVHQVRTHSAM